MKKTATFFVVFSIAAMTLYACSVADGPLTRISGAGGGTFAGGSGGGGGGGGATPTPTATPTPFAVLFVTQGTATGTIEIVDDLNNTLTPSDFFTVGNTPIGVALNPTGTRLVVANSGSDTAQVFNTNTQASLATVAVGNQPEQVEIIPSGAKAYISNVPDNSISVVSLTTFLATTIFAVPSPQGMTFNGAGTLLYVALGSGQLAVIDTATDALFVPLQGVGTSLRDVALVGSNLYISDDSTDEVLVVDSTTFAATVASPITVGMDPRDVTSDPLGTVIYVTNYNSDTISVIDPLTDMVTDTIVLPASSSPVEVAFSSTGSHAYVANENGTVSLINVAMGVVLATTPTFGAAVHGLVVR